MVGRRDCPNWKGLEEQGRTSAQCVRPFPGVCGTERSCRAAARPLLLHSSESRWELVTAQMPCSLSVVCDLLALLSEISA